jgi:hypothetical protein
MYLRLKIFWERKPVKSNIDKKAKRRKTSSTQIINK